jgi:hypothetical protein
MSASAIQRKAAEGLEITSCAKRIALSTSTDSASRHASHKTNPTARSGRVFADCP